VSLSVLGPGDVAALGALLGDDKLRALLYPHLRRPPDAERALAHWMHTGNGPSDRRFAVRLAGPALMGAVRIENGSLSYFIQRDWRGRGHGRAAVGLALQALGPAGELGLLQAFVNRDNRASRRILEGHGFQVTAMSGRSAVAARVLVYARWSSP
jgi:RimJ/RimL family protein N-acetyltransferase